MSGSTNVGDAFDLVVTRRAADSTYAGIVRLVEQAQQSRAPMVRLADRFAIVFLVVTVGIAGGAWILTGDPIRAVAVLVVATPCPLILAVPVALVAGLSRAARQGILIKGGKALEALARVKAVVVDKTGTLTEGKARLSAIVTASDLSEDEVLRLAASLDQASKHIDRRDHRRRGAGEGARALDAGRRGRDRRARASRAGSTGTASSSAVPASSRRGSASRRRRSASDQVAGRA